MPRQHPPDAKKPKNWAVVIGIDKYWDRSSCLREAVADALRVREWLLRPDGGAVVLERLFLFLGVLAPPNPEVTYKEATHLNIAKIFRDLNLQRGDRFFFYFAGHGIVDQTKGQDYGQFLIPEDCNPDRPNNALLLSDIISFCKHIGFDEQFFFSDACRTPWPEKNLAFARFPYLARGKVKAINQFVIYASSENTFAFDGIFNRALLKGLSGDDDARRWDPVREQHVVTFTSLFDYVASSAPKLQVARRGGESGRADGRPNDPILAAFDPPLPRPNPNRFSIAVSNLERDPKRELEHILVDQLSRIDEIVEVFRLGRPIAAGFQHDERSRAARDKALMILDATEIDGVIWGEALALDNQTGASLYFEMGSQTLRPGAPYTVREFSFPEVFWKDIVDFVALIIIEKGTEFYSGTIFNPAHRALVTKLDSFIDKVRRLLANSEQQRGWTTQTRASVAAGLGAALLTSADRSRGFTQSAPTRSTKLREAARLLESALGDWPPAREFERRGILGNLAIVQKELGNLDDAVAILRDLKEQFRNEEPPLRHAINLVNLGNALSELHERQGDRFTREIQFEEAASIYTEAIDASPQGSVLWAAALDGRAGTKLRAAEGAQGPTGRRRLLEQAEADIRQALRVLSSKTHYASWSNAMHRLAVILRRLGESDVGSDRLVQAVRVLRKLVSSCPDEGFPLGAFYKQSLANALSILGSRVGDPTPIREALKIRSNIVTVFRSENDTLAMEQNITDTRYDFRALSRTDPDFTTWLTENRALLEEIDPNLLLLLPPANR